MAKVNISEAASLSKVARSTLYAYIRSGKISAEKDHLGRPQIDTAELLRVFGTIQNNEEDNRNNTGINQEITTIQNENAALRAENEALREMLRMREEQLREHQEQEAWLRQRLDALEAKLLPGSGNRPWWAKIFGSKDR
ncbi:hypothetical protein [Acidithiobacillus concretivorus]|uniref:DNA-binding protein n=1 Tax=Acidithiobacillus concretivorus TaxID=3063952 RepID=A0ABS5ZT46_9PROT|nr:hypothetical protein [Acidithiobacillus concretivorus]MBU2739766.1 hypothetical protein [Acidithiobacillus concretivorus]